MKQRITYLLRDAGGVDPATLAVGDDSLKIPGLKGAKEWRVTVGVKELPKEVWRVLQEAHEVHIRWTSPRPYDAISPLVSRMSPGLYVSYTPRKDSTHDVLCPLLQKVFGDELSCHSIKESFTASPITSERFSMSAALQYYHTLPTLQRLVTYLQQVGCANHNTECLNQIADLSRVSSLDLDFDAISHALKVNAMWTDAPTPSGWDETIRLQPEGDSIEVGVLNSEKATEAEELSLGGFLTVIGEDTKPGATLFAFPSRHHPLPPSSKSTFSTSLLHPTGLHPTLQLTSPASSLTPPAPSCALHAYFTLPASIFLDRYQLSDPLFLASQNLKVLRSLSGESDLEAPVWVLKKWGSASLFELVAPHEYYDSADAETGTTATAGSVKDGLWNISIPLHLRYLPPAAANGTSSSVAGQRAISVPWPSVFWACEAEDGLKMSVNPFDRVNMGYDGLFGPKTMFYHIPPAAASPDSLVEEVLVPVIDLEKTGYVEMGTVTVVLVGFVWVCWMLVKSSFGVGTDLEKKKV